ncbi:MAG: efflux RND transporter permease subunit [Acidimicrobiia bacterium]
MMRWLVESSLKFRRIIVVLAAGLLVFGIVQLDEVKKDILPEFSPVTVEVQTEALGLSAGEVERLMTIPLEQDLLSGVAFLESIESVSLPGLSSVVMTFQPGTELLDARQVVAERLAQAAGLPQVAEPPQMIQPLSSTGRVAMVSMASAELTPIETSVLARWVVVPRLLGVKGVANISIWGFRDRQLQVLVDPARLDAQDVTLSQVIRTAGNALEVSPLTFLEASSPGTGGFIDTVNQRLHVFHEQAISTPEELAQVTVEGDEGEAVYVDGRPLTLGEVTEIVTGHQPLIGDARCSSGPCVLLVIEKFPDANTPEVTADIDEALRALSPGLPGVDIDSSIYRPADYVATAFNNLALALVISAVLLVLVLVALFRNWRSVFIAIASIATSLVAGGLVLYLAGVTVNVMILAGFVMALVVIVDDSIVGAWGQTAAASQSALTGPSAVRSATLRTRSPLLYSAVIAGAAVATFYFLEGEGGSFLPPIATAYLLAIAAALLVSLTVTPALSAILSKTSAEKPQAGLMSWIGEWYTNRASGLTEKFGVAVIVFTVFVGAAVIALPFIDQNFRPELKQRDVLVQLDAPPGTSLARMDEIAAQAVFDVGALEGVANVSAHVGRAITSDQVVNVNSAEIWAKMDDSASYTATLDRIEASVAGLPDVAVSVTTYSEQRVTEILDRSADELVVRVYGSDPDVLRSAAGQVLGVVEAVEGVRTAGMDLPAEEPTIEIDVDLDRVQAAGLKPGDVRRRAATLVAGIVVGNLFEEQKVFDVVVWGAPAIRQTVDDVRALMVPTPTGANVALGDLADVEVVPNATVIRHEAVESFLDVVASTGDRAIEDVAADIDSALAGLSFPIEYHARLLGGYADERAAQSRVISVVVAALIGIFIFLQAAFSSWRLALMVFISLPLAVAGGVVVIVISGAEASLGSVVGIIAIIALATRGTVLLIRRYEDREADGEAFGVELIAGGTSEVLLPTFGPILALAAVFVPLAVAGGFAGLEIVGPMAIVILGGLISTSLLLLFVLPAAYLRWGYIEDPDRTAHDLFEGELRDAAMGGE